MKIAAIVCLGGLFALTSLVHADGWEWVQPQPQGNDLYDVQFVNNNLGFAVGSYGTIIKTTDAGQTWHVVNNNLPITTNLGHVYFRDEQHGWLLENAGYYSSNSSPSIFRTVDGGATCTECFTLDSAIYSAIAFADVLHGFAVGERGRVRNAVMVRTTDGGETWSQTDTAFGGALMGIFFASASSGWLWGSGGLWHSADAGVTWTPVSLPGSRGVFNLTFGTERYAWADADSGLFRTTDGGATWNSLPDPYYGTFNRLIFANAFVGIGLESSAWCITQDGGFNWTFLSIPYDDRPNAFAHTVSSQWLAVGNHGFLTQSTNNGNSWSTVSGATMNYHDIAVFDSLHIWIASDSGLERSTDGGRTFERQHAPGTDPFYSLSFTSATNGWASGDYLYHTADGGLTWEGLPYWGSASGEPVIFFDSLNGSYALTMGDLYYTYWIVQTSDGGATWNGYQSPGGDIVQQISFVSSNVGWMVDYSGVWRTNRGPATQNWHQCLTSDDGASISPIDSLTCWAVTYNYNGGNGLYLTRDGGENWALLDSNYAFGGIAFSRGGRYGMSLGSGLSRFTSDSGATWTEWPMRMPGFSHYSLGREGDVWGVSNDGAARFVPPRGDFVSPHPPPSVPSEYSLTVYPNPFNATTTIRFALPTRSDVKIEVFDVLGRTAYSIDLGSLGAGSYHQPFDAKDLSSGIYFTRLRAGRVVKTLKIVLLR